MRARAALDFLRDCLKRLRALRPTKSYGSFLLESVQAAVAASIDIRRQLVKQKRAFAN
jgi:hypothetical protein